MSILGNRILGGAGQQPYLVGRSLRFRLSASAYLNRTPASAGNRKTWTWSGWVKIGTSTSAMGVMSAGTDGNNWTGFRFNTDSTFAFYRVGPGGGTTTYLQTNQVFRDPSAWYHIVLQWDTTQATSTNRVKLYVNGSQVTAFSTTSYPVQNYDEAFFNTAVAHLFGNITSNTQYLDGYIAEVNFIDGQALTPSSFGAYDNNGIWQPRKYGGTYGTNGFYLPFSNTTSTTTLVQDSSGNGNNWTPNNISLTAGTTYDSMLDSPTVSNASSNYCTFNPASNLSGSITNGNLSACVSDSSGNMGQGTFGMSSGKWYWEATMSSTRFLGGIRNVKNAPVSTTSVDPHFAAGTGAYGFATGTDIGTNYDYYNASTPTRVATTMQATTGVVVQFAFDADNGKLWLGLNGTWQSSGSPSAGTGNLVSPPTGNTYVPMLGLGNTSLYGVNANFGQQPFTYTPPTGFNALNTYNLPQPTIMNGAKYMQATLYTGNGSATQTIAQSVTGNSATFLPDFVWTKGRSGATNNIQIDTVRGGANYLISDSTSAEAYNAAAAIQSFSSNGYVIGNGGAVNTNAATYVSWQWNAGSGTTSTNTNGSISSLVSVNASAGFSIVSYVGTGVSNATVGHSLGVVPSMVIVKPRGSATDGNWRVKTTGLSSNNNLALNLTDAQFNVTTSSNGGIGDLSSSTTFTLVNGTATNNNVNQINIPYIAYCWSAVAGYSAFGSYTGNGSSDGPFVYIGFRPRWVMIKNITTGGANYDWVLIDSSREPYNVTQNDLAANTSASEASGILSQPNDFLSNGFKIRASGVNAYPTNASGSTYIYAAFAENPFKISRAR